MTATGLPSEDGSPGWGGFHLMITRYDKGSWYPRQLPLPLLHYQLIYYHWSSWFPGLDGLLRRILGVRGFSLSRVYVT
jgi:hypothetical protein